MTRPDDLPPQRRSPLPHQATFIAEFFANPERRRHLLKSDVGLGSTITAAYVVERVRISDPHSRVLVLVPKALQEQTLHVLSTIGVEACAVDRFRYREMQDAMPGNSTAWGAEGVFVLSIDFARQEDVASSLASVPWSLVVASEAHLLRGARLEVVRRIVASSANTRLLLLATTGIDEVLPVLVPMPNGATASEFEALTVTKWSLSEVERSSGVPWASVPPPQLELIWFRENPAESRLRSEVEVIKKLMGTADGSSLVGAQLVRSMRSSPAALEERLRGLLKSVVGAPEPLREDGDEFVEGEDTGSLPALVPRERGDLIAAISDCLLELESSAVVDSKFEAFAAKLAATSRSGGAPRAACVLMEYKSTLYYLQTQLEERGIDACLLHGGMNLEERLLSIRRLQQEGGVLLATIAAMSGVALAYVDWAVLYDLPGSALVLQQVYGRFQRIGRNSSLKLGALCSTDSATSDATVAALKRLQELVGDDAPRNTA